jgi:hypothetical protein
VCGCESAVCVTFDIRIIVLNNKKIIIITEMDKSNLLLSSKMGSYI